MPESTCYHNNMAANEGESLRLIFPTSYHDDATECPFLSKKPMTYGNAAVNRRLRVAHSLSHSQSCCASYALVGLLASVHKCNPLSFFSTPGTVVRGSPTTDLVSHRNSGTQFSSASCRHPLPLPSIAEKSALLSASSLTTRIFPETHARCNGVLPW